MKFLLPIFILSIVSVFAFAQGPVSTPPPSPGSPAAKTSSAPSQPAPVAKPAKSAKTTEQRIVELEQRLHDFEEWYNEFYLQSKNRVSPFLGEKISLGGFFETAISHVGGPDMETQTSANSNILGINLAAEFDENTRFVTQLLHAVGYSLSNPHNNPGVTPSKRAFGAPVIATLIAQAYVEIRRSELLIVQTGIGYAPYGAAYSQRELILFRRRGGPQLLSTSDSSSIGIAFPLWMGVNISGASVMEKGRVGYNLYTFSPSMNSKTIGAGARGFWSDSQNLTLGLSVQTADQGARGYWNSYAADVKYEYEKGGVVAEYAKSKTNGEKELESYYVEPYWNLKEGEWVLYVAADYINNPNRLSGVTPDPYEIWRYGAGANWLPIPNVRVRAGILKNDYMNSTDTIAGQERDYYAIDLSAGVAF
ncbi:MAG: hypothetical protein K0R29_1344 [Pseudobdellovibrio sp.]|jgi:hypothetical protein|nr:hypothetical protein [Pseudobdellovibrio sp.]